jgi:hypothetical protein
MLIDNEPAPKWMKSLMKLPTPGSLSFFQRMLDSQSVRLRLRDECDARVSLHIRGDCKLHTAFAAFDR